MDGSALRLVLTDILTIKGQVSSGTNTTLTDGNLKLGSNALANKIISVFPQKRASEDTPYISLVGSNTSTSITFAALPNSYIPQANDTYQVLLT